MNPAPGHEETPGRSGAPGHRTPWLRASAGIHACWSRLRRRHTHAPPTPDTGAAADVPPPGGAATSLWRLRTTVTEEPGSLATVCSALAHEHVNIVSLQTHPLGVAPGESRERTLDEFLLRAPEALEAEDLHRAVGGAGGTGTWAERADAHDLVDAPARVLGLAARTALDSAELPLALRQLLGRCTVRSLPAGSGHRGEGVLEDTVLRLPRPAGGALVVERPHLPFTPAEFARARALVELDARLDAGTRVPGTRQPLTLPAGQGITVRRADTRDATAARAMQGRCSTETLSLRYHGPVADADRFLDHLLSPHFGRTLAVETVQGRLVALGHLLWDGEETEVALLVEDAWQQRGIGAELLRQLATMAAQARSENIYAVTQASNTAMVAAMRSLGLPLDYQIEDGTLVITAQVTPLPAAGTDSRPGALPADGAGTLGTAAR